MGADNVVFLEILEWFDETGKELVHRLPETGSGEIKFGAQHEGARFIRSRTIGFPSHDVNFIGQIFDDAVQFPT